MARNRRAGRRHRRRPSPPSPLSQQLGEGGTEAAASRRCGAGRRADPQRGTASAERERMAIEIRGARADEMDEVLEMVPRVMGATREYFAAAYRNDPWGRPEHSRIVKREGRIVSHIR